VWKHDDGAAIDVATASRLNLDRQRSSAEILEERSSSHAQPSPCYRWTEIVNLNQGEGTGLCANTQNERQRWTIGLINASDLSRGPLIGLSVINKNHRCITYFFRSSLRWIRSAAKRQHACKIDFVLDTPLAIDSRISYQIAVLATKIILPHAISSSSVHRLNRVVQVETWGNQDSKSIEECAGLAGGFSHRILMSCGKPATPLESRPI
jgi:hypothetical protein